jgi:hypothetical protein
MKARGGRRKAKQKSACRGGALAYRSPLTIRSFAGALAVSAALLLGGCDYLPFGYTTAKEIVAAPGNFEGKEVKVKGKVEGTLSLLGMKGFTLRDETGEISVATTGELPKAGSDVAVKGTVRSTAIVGGTAVGLRIEETKRIR